MTSAVAAGSVVPGTAHFPAKDGLSSEAVKQIGEITKTVMMQAFTLDKCFENLKDIQALQANGMQSTAADALRTHVLAVCGTAAEVQQVILRQRLVPPPRNPKAD
nr:hypothetical protein [uncultured bacterium]